MVDMEVFFRLVTALHNTTRLVFVGDPNQLPSVGPGNVLSELINSGRIKVIALDKIFRQDECSDIIKEAERIRMGDTDLTLFSSNKMADIWHINEKNPEKIENLIKKFSQALKDQKKHNFQIFSPRNQGPLSVDTLNVALQRALNPPDPSKKEIHLNKSVIRKGDRVLITKNNYNLNVFNGDIGKVVFITPQEVCVDIDDFGADSRRINIPMEIADDHLKLAYAITIHKCLHPDSRIFTEGGYKALRDIKIGDKVMTREGRGTIKWVGYTGKKEIYEIITRSGLKALTSKDHKMLICDENGERYLETSKLVIGMYSVTPIATPFEGDITPVVIPEIRNSHKCKEINITPNIDKDLAWLIGSLIGEGCYTDKKDGTVSFTSPTSPELLEEFQRIISAFGINVNDHHKKGVLYSKYFVSRTFRDWMLSIGMDYHHSDIKFIPNLFFKINLECRRELIAGLFDTDGCIDKRTQARFTTSSEKLASDLQLLLKTIGVISFKSKLNDKHYKITISGSDLVIFKNQITLRGVKKSAKLLNIKSSRKSNHYVIPNGKALIESFKKSITENLGNTPGKKGCGINSLDRKLSIEVRNICLGGDKLRKDSLEHFVEFATKHNIELNNDLKKASEGNIYYDEILSIRKLGGDKIDMIDLEVDGDPSFVTDGMFCHNSQGQEYPIIIFPFIKAHGSLLLQRNLLYTAITRAKKKVIILGELSAIERAIMNNSIQEIRYSQSV